MKNNIKMGGKPIFRLVHFLAMGSLMLCLAFPTNATEKHNMALSTSSGNYKAIQHFLDKTAKANDIAGAQLSIIADGIPADFVTGMANVELSRVMTSDTVIQIGSTTKLFNAVIVMSLVDEGKLDLDEPVKTYIPDFTLSDKTAETTLTLRHLLSMSSGLDNGPYSDLGRGDEAIANYVASLYDMPQLFGPGKGYGYSNAGTVIAGYVAEHVTGRYWDDLLKERILKPAGLIHAGTFGDLHFQRVAVGHKPGKDGAEFEVIRPWFVSEAMAPAGATLAISAQDLARFGQIFINDGVAANGKRILSKQAIKTMMTPHTATPSFPGVKQYYGIGPTATQWPDGEYWGHTGANLGGGSCLYWLPGQKGVIAITVNAGGASTFAAHQLFFPVIKEKVMTEVFGLSEPKENSPYQSAAVADSHRYVGAYKSLYWHYEVRLDNNQLWMLTRYLPPSTLGQLKESVSDFPLIPLGGDRFLFTTSANRGVESKKVVVFFGHDKEGRAANLVSNFAAKRVNLSLEE